MAMIIDEKGKVNTKCTKNMNIYDGKLDRLTILALLTIKLTIFAFPNQG